MGFWRCEAYNSIGIVTSDPMYVNVKRKHYISLFRSVNTYQLIFGSYLFNEQITLLILLRAARN